jgi:hypothetical protein
LLALLKSDAPLHFDKPVPDAATSRERLGKFFFGHRKNTARKAYIAISAFIACKTVGRALLQAISGRNLQVNPGIAVQLQKVELL